MKLTDSRFKSVIDTLCDAYPGWNLPDNQKKIWKIVLKRTISDELLPQVIADWISYTVNPPKNVAEIIKYGQDIFKSQFDSADVSAELIISSARNAYYSTDDFEMFTDIYSNSFAAVVNDMPAQEAYIKENIRKHSSNPKVLIMVYDELKGEVKDCFTGDAEHGVAFLRNHVIKIWNTKIDDVAKDYLVSGNSDFNRLTENYKGLLEG